MIEDDSTVERRPAPADFVYRPADTRVGRLLAERARLILRNYPPGSSVRFGAPGPGGEREYRVYVPGAEAVLGTLDALEGA